MKENNSKMIILIVDDSSFSRNMINKELIEMGFDDDQIYQAASGEEALVKFKEKIILTARFMRADAVPKL